MHVLYFLIAFSCKLGSMSLMSPEARADECRVGELRAARGESSTGSRFYLPVADPLWTVARLRDLRGDAWKALRLYVTACLGRNAMCSFGDRIRAADERAAGMASPPRRAGEQWRLASTRRPSAPVRPRHIPRRETATLLASQSRKQFTDGPRAG